MTLNRVALGALLACGGLLMPATQAGAQATNTRPAPAEPFAITDNSFFVEEAFNQDRGIVQNIFTWARADGGGWDAGLTQEWPAPGMAHQLSYTLPLDGGSDGTHVGSVLLNYRFQALKEAPGHPAFSPRLSLILPTGRRDGTGDRPGLQMNLPFSKQVGDVYVHWNAGVTWLQGVLAGAQTTSLASPQSETNFAKGAPSVCETPRQYSDSPMLSLPLN